MTFLSSCYLKSLNTINFESVFVFGASPELLLARLICIIYVGIHTRYIRIRITHIILYYISVVSSTLPLSSPSTAYCSKYSLIHPFSNNRPRTETPFSFPVGDEWMGISLGGPVRTGSGIRISGPANNSESESRVHHTHIHIIIGECGTGTKVGLGALICRSDS
jgi:hypothetical protein